MVKKSEAKLKELFWFTFSVKFSKGTCVCVSYVFPCSQLKRSKTFLSSELPSLVKGYVCIRFCRPHVKYPFSNITTFSSFVLLVLFLLSISVFTAFSFESSFSNLNYQKRIVPLFGEFTKSQKGKTKQKQQQKNYTFTIQTLRGISRFDCSCHVTSCPCLVTLCLVSHATRG